MTTNPSAPPTGTEEDLLGALIATTWARRRILLIVCVVAGLAAGGASLLRPRVARVEVQIGLGSVPTGDPVESTRAVATRISSRPHLQKLLSDKAGKPADLPETLHLRSRPEVEARVVSLVVEDRDPQLALLVAETAAQGIVEEHARVLESFVDARNEQIATYEALLKNMEDAVRAPLIPGASDGDLTKVVEEEDDAWRAVVGLTRHISKLRDENMPPHATGSRVIFGPEVQFGGVMERTVLAGAAGSVAGFCLFLLLVLIRLVAAPYLPATEE